MVMLLLLLAITIVSLVIVNVYSNTQHRQVMSQQVDPLLGALAERHSGLRIATPKTLKGKWRSKPIEISIVYKHSDRYIYLSMNESLPIEASFVMTPQPEMFELRSGRQPLDALFAILQYPAGTIESLISKDGLLESKWVESWLLIDPTYPVDCLHKAERDGQVIKLNGDSMLEDIEVAANLLARTSLALQKKNEVAI